VPQLYVGDVTAEPEAAAALTGADRRAMIEARMAQKQVPPRLFNSGQRPRGCVLLVRERYANVCCACARVRVCQAERAAKAEDRAQAKAAMLEQRQFMSELKGVLEATPLPPVMQPK
jgi:hypothetical protein